MLHWSALARLATSCASKASNKDEKKNTTYSALVICTMHSTSLFHSTAASQRRFLSKNPKNPCYDAVDPLPSSHRSPLHFSQPLVLHRWGGVGVRDEKLSGLVWHSGTFSIINSGLCMGTFSHLSRLCIRAPSHLSGPCTGTFSPRAHSTTPADSPFSLLSKGISAA